MGCLRMLEDFFNATGNRINDVEATVIGSHQELHLLVECGATTLTWA